MAAKNSVSIKLLIDTKKNKVLFAEAGKDFVDFLFNLLALPVGTVICLLKKENMVGCLSNLYQSVQSLSPTYMQPNIDKNSLLQPKIIATASTCSLPLLLGGDVQMSGSKIFQCQNRSHGYVTDDPTTLCPSCRRTMNSAPNWVGNNNDDADEESTGDSSGGGYVKGVVTYMVMDDLAVKPMSTISSITMLNKFNVKDVGALEEKVVELTMTEGLKLLKKSLMSQMVLTNVFLGKSSA